MIRKISPKSLKIVGFFAACGLFSAIFFGAFGADDATSQERVEQVFENRVKAKTWVSNYLKSHEIAREFSVLDPDEGTLQIQLTLKEDMQAEAEKMLKRYRPDFGAIFMMDATTGKVLALASFEKEPEMGVNLNFISSYPSASIFKVITAAAATDKAGLDPDHKIYFNGGNYTLYKKNVLSDKINRWTRVITLKEAFARSINTAFGRLSLQNLEPHDIKQYAEKFYFNREIPSDFAVEAGVAIVPEDKGYELTEVASGFTRSNTMSPVLGAMIAATVANDGQMVAPYIVEQVTNGEGKSLYRGESLTIGQTISKESAEKIRELMEGTVLSGTSRRTFKKLVRDKKFKTYEFGGKTGHLTGVKPKGRVDWFVGYAIDGDQKLAIAALTVNKKYWTVKSSYLGQHMFRAHLESDTYREPTLAPAPPNLRPIASDEK